ncbi:MAG: hypothetical protein K1X64_16480 [Myxococcaceae bacterium]|nr:hypothetical protein [Myxococcaceae bacterium]
MAHADDTGLKLEIDGPGVKPETLDSVATLELGRAYFRLLQRVAEDQEISLELTGLSIEDKCAALKVTPANFKLAQQTVVRAHRIVAGEELSSHRLDVAAEDFRAAVRALPTEQNVAVLVGPQRLPVARSQAAKIAPRKSITRMRAVVLTVGAATPPFARLSSKSEARPSFTVKVKDVSTVQKLALHLGKTIDADVAVERDTEGLIVRGELLEYVPVDEKRSLEEWREWFASVAPDWSDVEDVEEALGRRDEEPRVDG